MNVLVCVCFLTTSLRGSASRCPNKIRRALALILSSSSFRSWRHLLRMIRSGCVCLMRPDPASDNTRRALFSHITDRVSLWRASWNNFCCSGGRLRTLMSLFGFFFFAAPQPHLLGHSGEGVARQTLPDSRPPSATSLVAPRLPRFP